MDGIIAALEELDHDNDDDWTADNLPRVERVNEIAGGTFTRKQITDAAPKFFRAELEDEVEDEEAEGAGEGEEAEEGEDEIQAEVDAEAQAEVEADVEAEVRAEVEAEEEHPDTPAEQEMPKSDLYAIDNILKRSWDEILHSEEMAMRAAVALGKAIAEKQAAVAAMNVEIDKLCRANEILSRAIAKFPQEDTFAQNIASYQEQALAARQERAENAQRFIKAGTTPKEVAKQMQVASPLDDAMKKRGSQRPVMIPR